ncbi:MAG TPA: thiamine biosynthesis protein ThiF, partial [Candidatus Eisenbacteria bacterium]|nr:thiamine biosynthesis protein ThiF [Candidatus Eisenbacteria bacterium]
MRPVLKPALRRVWRDATTLQLGLDPERAVVIGGLDAGAARLVESLDGTRDVPGLLDVAEALGVDRRRAGELIKLLERSGVLDDAATDRRTLRQLGGPERERLAPDLAAASVLRRRPDGGVGVLARRRAAVIAVHGAGRIGGSVTALLAAAGVGTVVV